MINKKAQISIEVTIVLAILVIGAVSLGVYYISNANRYREEAGRLDDNLNKLEDQGEIVEEESINPTCSDGLQNQGEEGVDCGDVCDNVCAPENPKNPFIGLNISFGSAPYIINQPIEITVKPIFNNGSQDLVKITELFILNEDQSVTNNCSLQTGELSTVGKYINLGSASEFEPLVIKITGCEEPGTYTFKFVGEYQAHTIEDNETITLTSNTLSYIYLSSTSTQYSSNSYFAINIQTNIGNVNITKFTVKKEVNGKFLSTLDCTVNNQNSIQGEFFNVGITDLSTQELELNIMCNTAGRYQFTAIGEYLGENKSSTPLEIDIIDTIVFALSIEPTPKMYEFFIFSEDYLISGIPNVQFDLNLTSNYSKTTISEIEIKIKEGSIYVLTDNCYSDSLYYVENGRYTLKVENVIPNFNLIVPNIRCTVSGEYQIRFRAEKEGVFSWSLPTTIFISDAFAYSEDLLRYKEETYSNFVYSKNGPYTVSKLFIEKETDSVYSLSGSCISLDGLFDAIGYYTDLGQTSVVYNNVQNFENQIICLEEGNYRFTYYIVNPLKPLSEITLQPLYITVNK